MTPLTAMLVGLALGILVGLRIAAEMFARKVDDEYLRGYKDGLSFPLSDAAQTKRKLTALK